MGADHNQQMTVNTTPISSAFNSSNVDQKKPPKELQDLQKALQSGDLTAAKAAFQAFTTKLQKFQSQNPDKTQNTSGSTSNPFQTALASLGQALQSGDLNAANQAFSQLGQVAKAHHHHGGQQAQSATQTQPTPTATSSDADRDGDGSGSASQIGKLNLSA